MKPLESREQTWLSTLIGPHTWVRVDVSGPMGATEIGHLIDYLTLIKGWREQDTPPRSPTDGQPFPERTDAGSTPAEGATLPEGDGT